MSAWQEEREELIREITRLTAQVDVLKRSASWYASDDTGLSSMAIAAHMLGLPSDGSYPHDAADLGRCLRLLRTVPEWAPRIGEMARYSKCWTVLCGNWDQLSELMEVEVGIGWTKGERAPATTNMVRSLLKLAELTSDDASQEASEVPSAP